MSLRNTHLALLLGAFLGGPASLTIEAAEPEGPAAHLETYTSPDGANYFSLCLEPDPAAADRGEAGGTDVVFLFDTSASQTGPLRSKALAALEAALAALGPGDRVQLTAVDLAAVPLTDGLLAAGDPGVAAALDQLRARVPLGATDLALALRAAAEHFDDPSRAHAVVYIGDGVSTARLLAEDQYRDVIETLVGRRAAVTSLAIGPATDSQLLATLANHTGGMLTINRDDLAAEALGQFVALAARQPVYWPEAAAWPAGFEAIYPEQVPPLRPDRETVVVGRGTLAEADLVTIEADGVNFEWTVEPSASDEAASYLAPLVAFAEKHHGLGLPTVGRAGLLESRRLAQLESLELTKLGRLAAATGKLDEAQRLAGRAAQLDPAAPEPAAVRGAVERIRSGAQAPPVELQMVAHQPAAQAAAEPNLDSAAEVEAGREEQDAIDDAGALIDNVRELKEVLRGQAQAEVRNVLNEARSIMGDHPDAAIDMLKLAQERILSMAELDPDVRSQLRDQLEAALRQASNRAFIKTEQDLRNQEVLAAAEDRRQVLEALYLKEAKIDQLMKRFEALVDQGQYFDAEIMAREANQIDPHRLSTGLGETEVHMQGALEEQHDLQYRRQVGLIDTLASVERSDIPTPDEPPILYPDPEVWQRLTKRRKEFAAVDLSSRGPAEERILKAMDEQTEFLFNAEPLSTVVEFIGARHKIPVHLVASRLEADADISSDYEVTLELRGVTLRSALRQLTREVEGLTYLIDNEILQFTSTADAEERPPIIKVYPVADLVVPIVSGGGGGGFGGGGFGGGGGGFGGGGFGGGGGGFGGGGFGGGGFGGGGLGGGGFGGGGGFFNVPPGMNLPFGEMLPLPAPGSFRAFSVKDELKLSGREETPAPKRPDDGRAADAVEKQAPPALPQPAAASAERSPAAGRRVPTSQQALPVEVAEGDDAEQVFNDYFATQEAPQGAIGETARRLMHKKRFEQVVGLLRAALRNHHAEPWMYEALSLAMQAAGKSPDEIERALLSVLDFNASTDQVLYLAAYLARMGYDRRALDLLGDVARSSPDRVEPYLLGLSLAERSGDLEGIRWTTTGVLSQAWSKDQLELWNRAQRLAKATLERLRSEGNSAAARDFQAQLDQAQRRDCVVVVSWTGDCDIDLTVQEPTGSQCSFRNPRTTGGGVMLGDAFSRADKRDSAGMQEVYVCPAGFDGTYRMLLRRVWGKPTAGKVTVDVYTHYGTPEVTHVGRQIPLGDDDALVLFELKDGRRTEALDETLLAQAANEQVAMRQQILAQQLNAITDNSSLAGFALSRRLSQAGLGFPINPRGGVGFAPIIQTLPKGAFMIVLPSVISADRRYVRVTPVPVFIGVSEVNTFNFATGASGTSGGAGFGGFSSTPGAGGVGT